MKVIWCYLFMLLKKNKGQVSIELLIILGLIVIGAIIFATNYLSTINRNLTGATEVPSAQQINRHIEGTIQNPTISSPRTDSGSLCGNGVIDALEVCDTDGSGVFPTALTCEDIGSPSGSLNCSSDCLKITCS